MTTRDEPSVLDLAAFVALIVILAIVAESCSINLTMPFCPVSDSAWSKVDSLPVACLTDTISQHRKHR